MQDFGFHMEILVLLQISAIYSYIDHTQCRLLLIHVLSKITFNLFLAKFSQISKSGKIIVKKYMSQSIRSQFLTNVSLYIDFITFYDFSCSIKSICIFFNCMQIVSACGVKRVRFNCLSGNPINV